MKQEITQQMVAVQLARMALHRELEKLQRLVEQARKPEGFARQEQKA